MQIQLYHWNRQNCLYLLYIKNFKIQQKLTKLSLHCLPTFCIHFVLCTCVHAQMISPGTNRFILTGSSGLSANQNSGYQGKITSFYLEWQNVIFAIYRKNAKSIKHVDAWRECIQMEPSSWILPPCLISARSMKTPLPSS